MSREGFSQFNIDTDSPAARQHSHETFLRFLKHAGIESLSARDKVRWIKSVDYEKFMDMLSVMNGILRAEDKFQRWKGKIVKSVVSTGLGGLENADLEPPDNADVEFKKLFQEMKENISEETIKKYAAKVYVGIIFSHMFPDGNGRIARNVYHVMSLDSVPDKDITTRRGREVADFGNYLNLFAIARVFKNHAMPVKQISDTQEYYVTHDGTLGGAMDHLKYLAVKEVLGENGAEMEKNFELDSLNEEQKRAFEIEYAKLRKEWFWETQKAVDEHSEWVIEELDNGVLQREHE